MKLLLSIGIGSFIGGIGRYLISVFIQTKFSDSFPYGTLIVNILGCFLIGIVYGFAEKGSVAMEWRLFLATGILGGFTTFSAFSYESVNLIRNGFFLNALLYISVSVIVGLIATFTGLSIIKAI